MTSAIISATADILTAYQHSLTNQPNNMSPRKSTPRSSKRKQDRHFYFILSESNKQSRLHSAVTIAPGVADDTKSFAVSWQNLNTAGSFYRAVIQTVDSFGNFLYRPDEVILGASINVESERGQAAPFTKLSGQSISKFLGAGRRKVEYFPTRVGR